MPDWFFYKDGKLQQGWTMHPRHLGFGFEVAQGRMDGTATQRHHGWDTMVIQHPMDDPEEPPPQIE